MKRQCAWCLRLMNNAGEHILPAPLPKLYDATHGICGVCGMRWIEQATGSQDITESFLKLRANMIENTLQPLAERNTSARMR